MNEQMIYFVKKVADNAATNGSDAASLNNTLLPSTFDGFLPFLIVAAFLMIISFLTIASLKHQNNLHVQSSVISHKKSAVINNLKPVILFSATLVTIACFFFLCTSAFAERDKSMPIKVNPSEINAVVDKENNTILWDKATITNTNSSYYAALNSIDTQLLDSNFPDTNLSIYVNNILVWQGIPGDVNAQFNSIYLKPNEVADINYSISTKAQSLYDLIDDNNPVFSVSFNGEIAENTISGTAVNEINAAVDNASVTLYNSDDTVIDSATTDANGKFSLLFPYGVTAKLKISHTDYILLEKEFLVDEDKDFSPLIILKENKSLIEYTSQNVLRFLPVFSDGSLTTNDILFFDDNGDLIKPKDGGNQYKMTDLSYRNTTSDLPLYLGVLSYKIFNPNIKLECYAYLKMTWNNVFVNNATTYPYTATEFTTNFKSQYFNNGVTTPYFNRTVDQNWCPSSTSSPSPTLNGVNVADAFNAYPVPFKGIEATLACSPVLAKLNEPYYYFLTNKSWVTGADIPFSNLYLVILGKTFN